MTARAEAWNEGAAALGRWLLALGLVVPSAGCGDGDRTREPESSTSAGGPPAEGGSSGRQGGGGQPGSAAGSAGTAGEGGDTGQAGASGAGCERDSDCEPLGECYAASCSRGACVGTASARGAACEAGFCNGFARCVPCLDEAAGIAADPGCGDLAPLCVETASVPRCVGCERDAHCDDERACTVDRCVDAKCEHAVLPAGATCRDGVCDGAANEDSCVPCLDDASAGTDRGCTPERPRCDTTLVPAACSECQQASDCDDRNECTADACNAGACEHATLPSGAPCEGGYCNGIATAEICIPKPCEDDASCDDGAACTADRCEASYLCSYAPDHDQCPDSGDVCRPNLCTVGIGCQAIDVSRSLELLENGYFEAGNSAWTEMSTNYSQVIFLFDYVPTLRAHTESFIAWLGGGEGPVDEHNSLSQRVSIPAGTIRLELSFFYQVWSDDLPDDQNYLNVTLRAPDTSEGDVIATFHNQDETRVWTRFTADLDVARWAGTDATLDFSGASVDGYTAFFIDTVSLRAKICK